MRQKLPLALFAVWLATCTPAVPKLPDGGDPVDAGVVPVGSTCHHPQECVAGATCVAPDVCGELCVPHGNDGGVQCPDGGGCTSLSVVGCCAGCACESAAVCP
jgi:hypothetical protein